jgi:multimeric flavodoxin WrbA
MKMKITILNGNPESSSFDIYLMQLQQRLESAAHTVKLLTLREMQLRYCTGCWGCWVKTPGECVGKDASEEIGRAVINADFVLWAAPLKMGFPSALLKMAVDKHVPLIHPYGDVDHSEAHHLKRYARYPRLGLLVEREADTDAEDMRILTEIFARTALNFKSWLEFTATNGQPLEEVAGMIEKQGRKKHLFSSNPGAIPGEQISPPRRMTVFNGSPRGQEGNTPIMLGEFLKGFGGEHEMHTLTHVKETESFVQAFAEAECAWLGFPLYTDGMPGIVKHFIEALEPLRGRKGNPPIGFLVQSGFPEARHSRYVEQYLQKLAARLGSPYLGTIVKGGGEGIRVMPPSATKDLFGNLQALGKTFAERGYLDAGILQQIAMPEHFNPLLGPVFKIALRLPGANGYFDQMLKQNGAYEKRFARPYVE